MDKYCVYCDINYTNTTSHKLSALHAVNRLAMTRHIPSGYNCDDPESNDGDPNGCRHYVENQTERWCALGNKTWGGALSYMRPNRPITCINFNHHIEMSNRIGILSDKYSDDLCKLEVDSWKD